MNKRDDKPNKSNKSKAQLALEKQTVISGGELKITGIEVHNNRAESVDKTINIAPKTSGFNLEEEDKAIETLLSHIIQMQKKKSIDVNDSKSVKFTDLNSADEIPAVLSDNNLVDTMRFLEDFVKSEKEREEAKESLQDTNRESQELDEDLMTPGVLLDIYLSGFIDEMQSLRKLVGTLQAEIDDLKRTLSQQKK